MLNAISSHRSIRHFKQRAIPRLVMDELLLAATRASTIGGMQVYSIVVSQSRSMLDRLAPLHFNQSAATSAAALVTFCVDVARFEQWCRQRGAEPAYKNFGWFVNGAIDALLASENFSLEAENQGLGICYLGTTLYTARDIIATLELPQGVIPITTVAVGYADQIPPITDRLPVEGVVHYEKYTTPTPDQLDQIYHDTENSPQTRALLEVNQLENLAKIFTEKRYTQTDNEKFSALYFDVLCEQGFFEK